MCFFWNARKRNTHVEATLNHPFPAQVALERALRYDAGARGRAPCGKCDNCEAAKEAACAKVDATPFFVGLLDEVHKALQHAPRPAWNDRSCFLSESRLEFTENRSCRSW